VEYKVIEASGEVSKLEAEVNRHIQEGWVPVGGIAVVYSPNSGTWWFYQAMVSEPAAQDRPPE
jgi:hypothetical protein